MCNKPVVGHFTSVGTSLECPPRRLSRLDVDDLRLGCAMITVFRGWGKYATPVKRQNVQAHY